VDIFYDIIQTIEHFYYKTMNNSSLAFLCGIQFFEIDRFIKSKLVIASERSVIKNVKFYLYQLNLSTSLCYEHFVMDFKPKVVNIDRKP